MKGIDDLLEKNRLWSLRVTRDDPDFFSNLARQQTPKYLWIGCADSRVSANTLLGLAPGEVFVHRNVANLVNHADMNCLAVMQFAIEVLQVEHIIVCGHYGCGGVIAAIDNQRHGLIDNWLRPIQDIAKVHGEALAAMDHDARIDRLCRLNVAKQVLNVGETTIVQDAWDRGQELEIHGWIYAIGDGLVKDLGISIDGDETLSKLRSDLRLADTESNVIPASNRR